MNVFVILFTIESYNIKFPVNRARQAILKLIKKCGRFDAIICCLQG